MGTNSAESRGFGRDAPKTTTPPTCLAAGGVESAEANPQGGWLCAIEHIAKFPVGQHGRFTFYARFDPPLCRYLAGTSRTAGLHGFQSQGPRKAWATAQAGADWRTPEVPCSPAGKGLSGAFPQSSGLKERTAGGATPAAQSFLKPHKHTVALQGNPIHTKGHMYVSR